MPQPEHLITKEFIALNAIMFLAFCNIAVFFQFHEYLGTLPIPAEYFGTLDRVVFRVGPGDQADHQPLDPSG